MESGFKAQKQDDDKPWAEMSGNEKVIFTLKVIIMVCSGGFIFGSVL